MRSRQRGRNYIQQAAARFSIKKAGLQTAREVSETLVLFMEEDGHLNPRGSNNPRLISAVGDMSGECENVIEMNFHAAGKPTIAGRNEKGGWH